MARRKEVFQSKVFQKLYLAAPKLEEEPSPPRITEALAKKSYVKRKTSQEHTGDSGKTQCSAAIPGRRMYTVLPPPSDYKTVLVESVTPIQPDGVNTAEDPAENAHESNDDQDQVEEEEEEDQKRRRRRRKRKPAVHPEKNVASPVNESDTGQSQAPLDEGGEYISRNKKRKLKKKRHKEKLLSMGLIPRAAALEFTYRRDEEEEEEEETVAAEVSDFLRTTMEIHASNSSSHVDKPPLLSGTVGDLLRSIAAGCVPTSALKQLCRLKAFVRQKETDKLRTALKDFGNTSSLSAEETTAVVSLFQYWITDVLPMQADKKTVLPPTHP